MEEQINFRLSAEQLTALKATAKVRGYENYTSFVRDIVLSVVAEKIKTPTTPMEFLAVLGKGIAEVIGEEREKNAKAIGGDGVTKWKKIDDFEFIKIYNALEEKHFTFQDKVFFFAETSEDYRIQDGFIQKKTKP